jgi:hypothetical protein
VLDRIATFQVPVYVAGDFNIRLDRPDDSHAVQLRLIIDCYGLTLHDTGPTHQLGGTLDAVITRNDVGCPEQMSVVDVGLSDHHLIHWSVRSARNPVPMTVKRCRPWRQLDIDRLRELLSTSRLCQPDSWPDDIDEMAALYGGELNKLLDQLIPVREVRYKPRATDPWFDGDCRAAKRLTRRLERRYSAACRRSAASTAVNVNVSSPAAAASSHLDVVAAQDAWYVQRRTYRQLRQRKCSEYWSAKVAAEREEPVKLWRSVDTLLGRGRTPANSAIDVATFSRFFVEKVAKVRASTSDAPPPTFTPVRAGVSLPYFRPLSVDDVISQTRRLPDKSSAADPLPTHVLKRIIDQIAPFVAKLFNCSLYTGQFPSEFKEAFITPIINKPSLDSADVSSYGPISNLSVLSKLFERLVSRQLMEYLTSEDLLPHLQSGFRPGHSTETAVLRVMNDILMTVDRGELAALVLLDLSAAFDTVDHTVLLERLRVSFGIDGVALEWFRSYLFNRSQYVLCGSSRSQTVRLVCGVPQGSVLGPILFILYTADLVSLVKNCNFTPHIYADDTHIFGSCTPSEVDSFLSKVSGCVCAVAEWTRSNRLQLNSEKTELLWCSTARGQHKLPVSDLIIGSASVAPVSAVRDLGILIDADLTMRTHVQRTVSRCFAALRQLRSIRSHVPTAVFRSLVVSLVLTRLDYGNSVLVGLSANLLRRL